MGRAVWRASTPPQPTQADLACDAEVGGLTPEEWHQAQQRAVALRIAHLQQAGRRSGGRPSTFTHKSGEERGKRQHVRHSPLSLWERGRG